MKPIKFDESNVIYGGSGVESLPALNDGSQIVSCWNMTLRERISALIQGKIWLCVRGQDHPAVWLAANKKDVFKK